MSTGLNLMRGAFPSPKHRIAAATPHVVGAYPPSYGVVPKTLLMWGNNVYGDCVSAEEAAAKAMYSLMRGSSELVIPEADLVAWARQHRLLNGADLTSVMDLMASEGITVNGVTYKDGPYQSVDWTNSAVLSSAIYQGPVKIAVSANQYERCGAGQSNGWIASGFTEDKRTDHCVNICGYGTAQELATILGTSLAGKIAPTSDCVLVYTWATIGIVQRQSMIATTDEAWLRSPTTIPDPDPNPTPAPSPAPAPTPMPGPGPQPSRSGTVIVDYGSRTISAPPGFTLVPSL